MQKGEAMKKVITYTEEQVKQIFGLLNCVTISGIQNSKQIAAIAQILDAGTPGEIGEMEQPEKLNGLYSPADWENMLEKKTEIGATSSKEFEPRNRRTIPVKAESACTATNNAMPAKEMG